MFAVTVVEASSMRVSEEPTLNKRQGNIREFFRKRLLTIETTPFHYLINGPGGCGKSVLLRAIRDDIRKFFACDGACIVTAATGGAAHNVQGLTIHAALGISPNEADTFTMKLSAFMFMKTKSQLENLKVLFIEEISLLDAVLFAQLSAHLQIFKESPEPFGGVSVIAFGDLMQLSPFKGTPVFEALPMEWRPARDVLAPSKTDDLWGLFKCFTLVKNERTVDDLEVKILMEIRSGSISIEAEAYLRRFCLLRDSSISAIFKEFDKLCQENPGKVFTILTTKNADARILNNFRMRQMTGVKHFRPLCIPKPAQSENQPRQSTVPPQYFYLAIGCQVMLTQNMDLQNGLVNGAIGTIEEFTLDTIKIKFSHSLESVSIERQTYERSGKYWKQFPLRPAEAMTVHIAQGKTYDGVIVLSADLFQGGLMYTALSRARSLKLSRITKLDVEKWKCPEGAVEAYEKLRKRRHE